jgi:hypothetical protein
MPKYTEESLLTYFAQRGWGQTEDPTPSVLLGKFGNTYLVTISDKEDEPIIVFCSRQEKVYAVPRKYTQVEDGVYIIEKKPYVISCSVSEGLTPLHNFVMTEIVQKANIAIHRLL